MLHYDTLKYMYLSATVENSVQDRGKVIEKMASFGDINRYSGGIPSPGYISYVYNGIMKEIRPFLDAQMTKLGGKILSAFPALYTVCNKYGEIRMMILAPTKSLEHLEDSLKKLIMSYEINSNPLPLSFLWTMLMAIEFLDSVIPSLKNKLVHIVDGDGDDSFAIESKESRPLLLLLTYIPVHIFTTTSQMNSVCQEIIGDLQIPTRGILTDNDRIYVGFDIEWRVFDSSRRRVPRKTGLMQIAYRDCVYLFCFCSLRPEWSSPTQVKHLLESRKVIKLGRSVKCNFNHLNAELGIYCQGEKDVLDLCIEKGAVGRKNVSLDHLIQPVLGFRMNKSHDVRLSSWDAIQSSHDQIIYAALGGWVSLELRNQLSLLPTVNRLINVNSLFDQNVAIFSSSVCRKNPVAYGIVLGEISSNNEYQQLISSHSENCTEDHSGDLKKAVLVKITNVVHGIFTLVHVALAIEKCSEVSVILLFVPTPEIVYPVVKKAFL